MPGIFTALKAQTVWCLVMHVMGPGASRFPGSGPDEEEEEELSVLMQKLRAAKPPAEVMKVCIEFHCYTTPEIRNNAAQRHSCGPVAERPLCNEERTLQEKLSGAKHK